MAPRKPGNSRPSGKKNLPGGVKKPVVSGGGRRGRKGDGMETLSPADQAAFDKITISQLRRELMKYGKIPTGLTKIQLWNLLKYHKRMEAGAGGGKQSPVNNPNAPNHWTGTARQPVDLTSSPNHPINPTGNSKDPIDLMSKKSSRPLKNPLATQLHIYDALLLGSQRPKRSQRPYAAGQNTPVGVGIIAAPQAPKKPTKKPIKNTSQPAGPLKVQGLLTLGDFTLPGTFTAKGAVSATGKITATGTATATGGKRNLSEFEFEGAVNATKPGQEPRGVKRSGSESSSEPESKKPKTIKTPPPAPKPPVAPKKPPTAPKPAKTQKPLAGNKPDVLAGGLVIVRRHPKTGAPDQVLLDWRTNDGRVSIPGGLTDKKENPLVAAVREAQEETGLTEDKIHVWRDIPPLAADFQSVWGLLRYYTYVVDCKDDSFVPKKSRESTAVKWTPLDKVASMPKLHDGFAAAWPALEETVRGLPPPEW